MRPTDQLARWQVTDTLSVPVTVLHVAEDQGRARVTSASGEKWVQLSELVYDEEAAR